MTNGPTLTGFLTFADRPKADAAAPITELERLGVHHQGGAPHRKGRGINAS
jgi:cation transport ATPase